MQRLQRVIGSAGYDGAGGHAVSAHAPVLPDTGERQRSLLYGRNLPWLLVPFFTGPFIEPACRDQTATLAGGLAKGGLFGNGFGPRIDQKRSIRKRRRPMRNKAPAHRQKAAVVLA